MLFAELPMPGRILDAFFGCSHRRTTFPITRVDQAGATTGAIYVVCLECGKQFTYDWNKMHIGEPVDISAGATSGTPNRSTVSFATKSKLRLALWASTVTAAWAIGKAITSRKRSRDTGESAPDKTISNS
jgi:hypothetical protein